MASDVIDPNRYPDQPWTSPLNAAAESQCSRAERVIEYTALASDAGKQYRVCMAARDDSDACAGVAPTASLRGWYGETQCIIFDVLRPVIQWHADTAALFAQETEAVVGCTTQLTMTAVDVSKSAVTLNSTGNYHLMLFPEPSVPLPAEMSRHVFAALASPSACSSLGVHPYHACACAHACKSAVIESERVCVCVCVQKVCVRACKRANTKGVWQCRVFAAAAGGRGVPRAQRLVYRFAPIQLAASARYHSLPPPSPSPSPPPPPPPPPLPPPGPAFYSNPQTTERRGRSVSRPRGTGSVGDSVGEGWIALAQAH